MIHTFKITIRAARKSVGYTTLNIFGLAIGFAGFILAYAYINRENSYDTWNDNYENIYLIGNEQEGSFADLTPAGLSPKIQAQLPEIALSGRVAQAPYEFPFISDNDVFFIKRWLAADKSIAQIFQIEAAGYSIVESNTPQVGIFSKEVGKKLFPGETGPFAEPKTVALINEKSGFFEQIHAIGDNSRLSNIQYDYMAFKEDVAETAGNGSVPSYQTYIQVKPGTDIRALTTKINQIYQNEVLGDASQKQAASTVLYLDPLKNLHLHPKHGSATAYHMVIALGTLSIIILVLACVNFANMMVVQAQQRAKEIGVKKLFGVSRARLTRQFMMEVFLQCLLAAAIATLLVYLSWNTMRIYFQYDFDSFQFNQTVAFQLGMAVLGTTLVAGLYPAVTLSGFRPVAVLSGRFQTSHKTATLRHALLTFQFVIAFLFISSMLVISRQLDYMKNSDKGFSVDQVLYVKNMAWYNDTKDFEAVRTSLKSLPGVRYATVASNVPGGNAPKSYAFQYQAKEITLDHIAVDLEYFETLDIHVLAGKSFSNVSPGDTSQIVLNSSAAKALGITDPIGQLIKQGECTYRITALVEDSKMEGFEQLVRPMAYTLDVIGVPPMGQYKVEMMIKLASDKVQSTLKALQENWTTINPKDGQHLNYEFLDQKFAHSYADQEKLKNAFTAFSYLILLVALIGLFAMSAYAIHIRQKEIGIRKVLGADVKQIFLLLNRPFVRLVAISIAIATPIAWWASSKWLHTFAYRIELSWWIFFVGAGIALSLALLTVCYQALKAATANPVESLRDE
ncbi:ABC transporter permease [Olivibacter sitiensis]|uniref:ABC transporter permease n=1 Tax=Olivibacter sitiensis TaxID=376470 RepID=UPI000405FA66|nr:FtsX-like permease family protein [Olivibacter sitiensis]